MATFDALRKDVNSLVGEYGQVVRLRYYTVSGAVSGYDDDVVVSKSGGDVFFSGLVQPVGANESQLVQQGKLLRNDVKLYMNGSVSVSGSFVKYGLGSPSYVEHYVAEDGLQKWSTEGQSVFNKVFLRHLTNGSFDGEA